MAYQRYSEKILQAGTLLSFEEFIEKSNRATTTQELFSLLLDSTRQHGMDRFLFCMLGDHRDIGEEAGVNFYYNYPEHWMTYYQEKQLGNIDPVIFYAMSTNEAFSWDSIGKTMPLSQKQQACLDMGRESGLYGGICAPLRGADGKIIAGLGLASSEDHDNNIDGKIDLITAYCNHFYTAYRRLKLRESTLKKTAVNNNADLSKTVPNYALTQRERDILCWAARGKSKADIAGILNISEHTVDYHQRNIFKKLETHSIVLAVVKAMSHNLIQP